MHVINQENIPVFNNILMTYKLYDTPTGKEFFL